ncbi:unnamed protein product [Sphenostylis stenocarpa]|uniref:Uncharacterized protein n=1 Tax=Sphenostylis stenocarpa TaxID=92480 RepID=A0AA87B873_9FABA|nr:unnamed protein product [Sphenostylis stenocarpa]
MNKQSTTMRTRRTSTRRQRTSRRSDQCRSMRATTTERPMSRRTTLYHQVAAQTSFLHRCEQYANNHRNTFCRYRTTMSKPLLVTGVSANDLETLNSGMRPELLQKGVSKFGFGQRVQKIRTIVDHQIRWYAIFTLAHKHKYSARNIIPKYSKDSNIVNQEGGKTHAEFPNSIELGKLPPDQDPSNI